MIINEETKVILLHNPKCGGTFIRESYTKQHHSHDATDYWELYEEVVNTDLGHISLLNIARFIPDYRDYKIISFMRNPYNRFVSALKESSLHNTEIKELIKKYNWNLRDICDHLSKLNYYKQDSLLRNLRIPWLNPQSNYISFPVIVLRYESIQDWNFIFNAFKIPNTNIHIKEDYQIDDYTKKLIRDLYFDDEKIFQIYK